MPFLWVKAWHIIAVVCWFAGLFYLPRLFVYHAECRDEISNARFKIMERRLYRGIATPSMILTVAFGSWLIALNPNYYLHAGWMHAKLALVAILLGYHHICGRYLKAFALDQNRHSSTFYRIFNEVTVIILIAVVCLVVVKPF